MHKGCGTLDHPLRFIKKSDLVRWMGHRDRHQFVSYYGIIVKWSNKQAIILKG